LDCEFCGNKIPSQLLYSEEQVKSIDKQISETNDLWLKRQRELNENKSGNSDGTGLGGFDLTDFGDV
jgi:hypothetical protein